jgi:hypothetical protein
MTKKKLPKTSKIVETYWHDHSLESSWEALSDGTISNLCWKPVVVGLRFRPAKIMFPSWQYFRMDTSNCITVCNVDKRNHSTPQALEAMHINTGYRIIRLPEQYFLWNNRFVLVSQVSIIYRKERKATDIDNYIVNVLNIILLSGLSHAKISRGFVKYQLCDIFPDHMVASHAWLAMWYNQCIVIKTSLNLSDVMHIKKKNTSGSGPFSWVGGDDHHS